MESKNIVMIIIAASLFGAVSSASVIRLTQSNSADQGSAQSALTKRLELIERRLNEEQQARLQFESVIAKETQLNALNSQVESSSQATEIEQSAIVEDAQREAPSDPESREVHVNRRQTDFKRQALIRGGFSEDEATRVLLSESEVSLQVLNDRYNARREAIQNAAENRLSAQQQLREKLGDNQYERYRKANGLPTFVAVDSILNRSPGQNAGIQAGDKIISYNNQRVFDVRDLNNLTARGSVGESILIEIEREGNPVQLTIPRGPIGITSSGGWYGR